VTASGAHAPPAGPIPAGQDGCPGEAEPITQALGVALGWLFAPATLAHYRAMGGHFAWHVAGPALADLVLLLLVFRLATSARALPMETRLRYEGRAYRVAAMGFPLLTLGLVLGAVWGKLAWGDYWNWDPKELWSLVSWLVYLGYFHVRSTWGVRYPRLNAALVLAGLVAILVTLLWVNLGRIFAGGMHSYA
jgi:ABC-type transport system involved in cytochrome c biogenesis permease subunit